MTAGGRLAGRIALVTGASRGIGAAVARRFGAEGAQVVAVARTVGGLTETDDAIRAAGGPPAVLVPLDLTRHELIDQLGGTLFERFGRLDVLVGSAGILGTLGPLAHEDPTVWQRVIDLVLTANWRLIRAMDTLLRASDAGRAIFVTAAQGHEPTAYWGAYAAAKAGLEMLARTYAAELAKTRVRVCLIDPGPVRTALRAKAFPGEDPARNPAPDEVTEAFVKVAEASG